MVRTRQCLSLHVSREKIKTVLTKREIILSPQKKKHCWHRYVRVTKMLCWWSIPVVWWILHLPMNLQISVRSYSMYRQDRKAAMHLPMYLPVRWHHPEKWRIPGQKLTMIIRALKYSATRAATWWKSIMKKESSWDTVTLIRSGFRFAMDLVMVYLIRILRSQQELSASVTWERWIRRFPWKLPWKIAVIPMQEKKLYRSTHPARRENWWKRSAVWQDLARQNCWLREKNSRWRSHSRCISWLPTAKIRQHGSWNRANTVSGWATS